MEENLYAPPKSNLADIASGDSIGLYSPRQIYTASFLGGPFAGAWFLSRNFRLLSRGSDSDKTLIIGVAVVIGLFPLPVVLPKNFPQVLIPLAYSYPFFYFSKRLFVENAGEKINFVSGWVVWLKIVGVALLWLVPTMLVWVTAGIFLGRFFPKVLPL
jgi:hypothetical protein